MRKGLIFVALILAVPFVLFASALLPEQPDQNAAKTQITAVPDIDPTIDILPVPLGDNLRSRNSLDSYDSTLSIDSLEGSFPAWTSADLTAGVFWHVDDTLTLGGVGTAWWCGDRRLATATTAGGYNSHWLQYLVSDTMDLSSSSAPQLAFLARWKNETPGGEPDGYNLWDAWNVWASTDLGATWAVRQPVAPAYTGTSAFSFGDEWNMGTGIPGYAGTDHADAYVQCTFDLTDLAGQANVLVRWAFCSDPAFSGADDSTYYGLIVDSIRVVDGATTILSNDGVADEFTLDVGPTAADTWTYDTSTSHSPTHSWTCAEASLVGRSIYSYPITLPTLTSSQQLSLRYWVWCDMPDASGGGGTSLEDYYQIFISTNEGLSWVQLYYDYGYANSDLPPGGNSLTGWVKRIGGLTSGGTANATMSLTPYAGMSVRLAFRVTTDNNDDGGVGTGLHIDDVEIAKTARFADDLATKDLHIPMPTTVGLVRPFQYTVYNDGFNGSGNPIRSRWYAFRPNGTQQVAAAVNQIGTLTTGQDTVASVTTWTPDVTGLYRLNCVSAQVLDNDSTNNRTYSPSNAIANPDSSLAVDVKAAGTYELGYSIRSILNAYLNPRYFHFTPAADGVPAASADTVDMTSLRVMWRYDPEMADSGCRVLIQFWNEGVDTFHTGSLINQVITRIDTSETIGAAALPHWWTLPLNNIAGLHNHVGNFWVSLTPLDSIDGSPSPLPLGQSLVSGTRLPTYDGHTYYLATDTLRQSAGRLLCYVTVVPTQNLAPTAVNDLVVRRVGTTNDIKLDWTARTNNNGFYVYRMNLPTDNPPTGTLLTPLPISGTTFTDVGIVATGVKYFYAVVAVN